MFQVGDLLGLLGDLLRLVGDRLTEPLVLSPQSFDRARLAIRWRLIELIVVASASSRHATFMADSRQKYKYGILDHRN